MLRPALAEALETFVDELAELVARKVVDRLQQGTPDMVDQSNSPLGRRRHCYAVRRRISEHKPGAAVVGRRHLLTREALAEELARLGMGDRTPTTGRAAPVPSANYSTPPASGLSVADELRRDLAELERLRRSGMSDKEASAAVLAQSRGKQPRRVPKSSKS